MKKHKLAGVIRKRIRNKLEKPDRSRYSNAFISQVLLGEKKSEDITDLYKRMKAEEAIFLEEKKKILKIKANDCQQLIYLVWWWQELNSKSNQKFIFLANILTYRSIKKS